MVPAIADWSNYFAAQLGASAALAGLLFVGMSLNMTKILQYASLVDRALQALALLMTILVVSTFLLVPGQSDAAVALELIGVGVVLGAVIAPLGPRTFRRIPAEFRRTRFLEEGLVITVVLLYVVSGISVLAWGPAGIYVLVPATLISFLLAVLEAWVLLVEVNR